MHTAGGFLCRVEAKPTRDAEVQQLPHIALSEAAGPRCMPKLSLFVTSSQSQPRVRGNRGCCPHDQQRTERKASVWSHRQHGSGGGKGEGQGCVALS